MILLESRCGTRARARRVTDGARFKISQFLTTAKMTRFAFSIGCPLTAQTFTIAAKNSSLTVLKTLKNLGCVRSYKVSRRLAMREDLYNLRRESLPPNNTRAYAKIYFSEILAIENA